MNMVQWLDISTLKQFVVAHGTYLLARSEEFALLTPKQASVVIVLVVIGCVIPAIGVWLSKRNASHRTIALLGIAPVITLALLLRVPSGFQGMPDDNCSVYDGGRMTFTLVRAFTIPANTEDIYGDGWLILIVQAAPRWGSDTHQCRLSLGSDKAKELMGALAKLGWNSDAGSRWSRGAPTFSFGEQAETPNVKIEPLPPDEKVSPPEVPHRRDA
ncbi:MAG TPA: hypothetical protein VMU25_00680 [Candidatus Paceibacterota bacterium]|nr:hypothetical protein [Candidatus Paceibacterota bacterium]